jgi:hypothetical protein
MKKLGITTISVIILIFVTVSLIVSVPATAAFGYQGPSKTPASHPLPIVMNGSKGPGGIINQTHPIVPFHPINQTHVINQSRINEQYIRLGQQRLSEYNHLLSMENTQISNMESKGFDVSGMQSVVAGAQANVVTPLQNAVNTGNGTVIKEELKSVCLDNGMPYSYHYSAQINLARLTSINDKLATLVNNTTIQGQISDVSSKLSAVSSNLDSIGTSPYTGSQESQVWDGMKAASQELKTIIREINSEHHT